MQLRDGDDKHVIEQARNGDREAFDEILRQHTPQLYRLAYRLTRDYDQAGDVVADTFVRAFNGIRDFKGDSAMSTWLYRILLNSFLDSRKRASSRSHLSLDDGRLAPDDGQLLGAAAIEATPDNRVVGSVRLRRLNEAVAGLPDLHRTMIIMYHGEGLSYEEIAEISGVPVGTVKSRLNRARNLLRHVLDRDCELFLAA